MGEQKERNVQSRAYQIFDEMILRSRNAHALASARLNRVAHQCTGNRHLNNRSNDPSPEICERNHDTRVYSEETRDALSETQTMNRWPCVIYNSKTFFIFPFLLFTLPLVGWGSITLRFRARSRDSSCMIDRSLSAPYVTDPLLAESVA